MTTWDEAAREVAAQTVKIETHDSWGTGFLIYGDLESWVRTIGTAYHVIENAYKKPFTVTTADGRAFTLGTSARDVLIARMDQIDAVTLICVWRDMPMPTVPLLEKDEPLLSVGTELGWLGYPRVADGLCFFSGRVSMIVDRDHFLVDGTAIHGVSGGPAFCITDDGPRIVGSITSYLPNRVDKDTTLPGLSLITHVASLRDMGVEATGGQGFKLVNRRSD